MTRPTLLRHSTQRLDIETIFLTLTIHILKEWSTKFIHLNCNLIKLLLQISRSPFGIYICLFLTALFHPKFMINVMTLILIYRRTSICQTCLSRKHHLCRSDRPFPNFSPIFYCISTLFVSNSLMTKTRLYRSYFSFP